jgi:MFS family permease
MLRVPIPSYLLWAVVAAIGAATVLSFAILAEYFPKQLAGRANGALNLFHIAAAFAVQYATGVVLQHWTPQAGHYPEFAYQTAFAINLALQVAAWIWYMFPRVRTYSRQSTRESGRISDPEGVDPLIRSHATMYTRSRRTRNSH